jgi:hypothetical protein
MEVDQDANKLEGSSLGVPTMHDVIQAFFTLRVRANVPHKSSIPIGAKVEISPKGFTLGLKAKIEKYLQPLEPMFPHLLRLMF